MQSRLLTPLEADCRSGAAATTSAGRLPLLHSNCTTVDPLRQRCTSRKYALGPRSAPRRPHSATPLSSAIRHPGIESRKPRRPVRRYAEYGAEDGTASADACYTAGERRCLARSNRLTHPTPEVRSAFSRASLGKPCVAPLSRVCARWQTFALDYLAEIRYPDTCPETHAPLAVGLSVDLTFATERKLTSSFSVGRTPPSLPFSTSFTLDN